MSWPTEVLNNHSLNLIESMMDSYLRVMNYQKLKTNMAINLYSLFQI